MKRFVLVGLVVLTFLGAFLAFQQPVQENSRTIMQFAADTNTTANDTVNNTVSNNTNNSTNTTNSTGGAGFFDSSLSFVQAHLNGTVLAAIVLVLGVLMIVHNRFSTILGILLFLGGTVYLLYTLGYLNSLAGMLPGV